MSLLTPQEHDAFRIAISSKPLPELNQLFNQLSQDSNNERLADNLRGKASMKMAMVKAEIGIRNSGGFSG